MKIFIVIPLLLIITSSYAQENWDMYMTTMSGRPASVLVDLNVVNFAPDVRMPFLVITGPRANKCDAQGLPDKDEIDRLEVILDETGNFLSALTPKGLVGTLTYNCERVNYYYVKDTTGIRTAIHRLYTRSFSDYKYALNIKRDPDWKTYRYFLYPTDENYNWMENSKVITRLLQQGDSLSRPRKVQFALFFKTDTGRAAFNEQAVIDGFNTERLATAPPRSLSFGTIISKQMPADMGTIKDVTLLLREQARIHSGKLDSWDAPVMK